MPELDKGSRVAYIPIYQPVRGFPPVSTASSPFFRLPALNTWFQFTIQIPESESERISALLFDLGSSGLEEDGGDDTPIVRLTAYFPASEPVDAVRDGLIEALAEVPGARIIEDGAEVPQADWGAKWREHFEPVYPTERIVVHPPWEDVEPPAGGFAVVIEPKTAFGTGSHATTRMALIGLERTVRAGDRVLDVGTGSGILGIAAVKLGAREVVAVDTDPLATENVEENVGLNGVAGIRVETRPVSAADTGFDVTVANIIRSVLTPMLPTLAASVRPGGAVILGGLLDREEDTFSESVEGAGLSVEDITREAEWIGLIARRR